MMKTRMLILTLLVCGVMQVVDARADETSLFTTTTAPDALIILDLSGSMLWNPSGGSDTYGNASCSGGTFYQYWRTGYTTNCSRLDIAKRAIFDILDDNGSNTITSADETSLGVRIGYMRFYDCRTATGTYGDTGNNYTSGCNKKIQNIGTSYSSINTSVSAESATGGTHLAASMNEAKLYLDDHKAADAAKDCRQKFVILITDGADTFACDGTGTENQSDMYMRRRETVAKAKALADAGYRLFVIGFGSAMPDYLEKTLNWTAYFGGTDNPLTANAGSTTGYNPSAVTACGISATTGTCNGTSTNCFATANDPGNTALSGYAFLASDGDQLATQLKAAIAIIREATYSFSQSSIQSSRTADENYIYEGSFQPVTGDPFWRGHLRRFSVNSTTGAVATDADWDAGSVLSESTTAASRYILTYKTGAPLSLINFTTPSFTTPTTTTPSITKEDLAVTTDAERDAVVGYIRGDTTYNPDNWKLGDVFRSTPITVGEPSPYFDDVRDANNAFSLYRTEHPRKTDPYSGRVVIAGANDGQMHAFKTSDGHEAWSFIPPNLLSRLKLISHAAEPTSLTHQYYVDGPVTVADTWLPSSWTNGRSKSKEQWRTLMVFGEGRGAGTNLWSSSASCDSGFNPAYTSVYPYYCGYYALDLTADYPTLPVFKWRLGISSAQAPYMGAPWSKVMVGRILDGGLEKWVGFVGGGAYVPGAADSGKGFFVIDLYSGNVLWSRTKADDVNLNYPMPATPSIVDTDSDGFIDTVYLGDLGGHMWRFKFCRAADGDSCSTSNWTGARLFQASSSPIYTSAAVAKDSEGNLWVYWGTGDKLDPTNATASEKIMALKDDRATTRTIGALQDISTAAGFTDTSKFGWYITLGTGEKVLADPTVFGGVLYVTTFTPSTSTNPCFQGGTAKLYGLSYTTGAGALVIPGSTATPPRSIEIGTGIPSAPVISLRPNSGVSDLYVTTSGGAGAGAQSQRVNINPPGLANRTNMLFWKDKRME